ncbi:hypothetical protein DPV78_000502 [Talaromyces pinophilus]|nr:hypothetical protein DPV78_000502 [Talaromyces pinophilus]
MDGLVFFHEPTIIINAQSSKQAFGSLCIHEIRTNWQNLSIKMLPPHGPAGDGYTATASVGPITDLNGRIYGALDAEEILQGWRW